ncbi:S8 family serine peptidase [Flavobacterium sp. JP2137]|uniref:S8 family serine peptidase n=1 Tax=Flavobacterium sp. JP2137 TaxID=3414510 RepID=UPI003D2FCFB2
MKIKTQYVLFACTTLAMANLLNAQNTQQREYIIKNTQAELLHDFAASKTIQANQAFDDAVKAAKIAGLPISGYDKEGNFFEIKAIDAQGRIEYYSTKNAGSRKTARVNQIQSDLGITLTGKNMIAGVWDGGVALRTHNELINRVEYKDRTTRTHAHATHVTGTIAASGVKPQAKGMAPEAKIWSNDWRRDTAEMAAQAAEGLLVSNHSYGVDTSIENFQGTADYFGSYDYTSYEFDWVAFNAPYYQPVVAAGNDRRDYRRLNPTKNGNDLLLGASLAKNSVIVAAVYEVANYTNANQVIMSDFSNYGPTDDFRIKPDISAKGVQVISPIDEDNSTYGVSNGTSMAAPAVTGVFVLWQQYGLQMNSVAYRSATLRALMAQTADEAGLKDGPDHQFGWGLINAKGGIEVITASKSNGALVVEETLNQSATFEREFVVQKDGTHLAATIAWTDSPRADNNYAEYLDDPTPALNNDLDLRIFKDGVAFLPWKLNKNFAALNALKGDNDVDNIEKVEIPNATAGTYKIVVSHKGQLARGEQDFSLVVSSKGGNLSMDNATKLESELRIWPNPAKDFITIESTEENIKDASVSLFDISGKQLLTLTNKAVYSSTWTIPLNDLSTGIYFLKFSNANGQVTKKILIK